MNLINFLKNQDFKPVTCFTINKYLPNLGFLIYNYLKKHSKNYNFITINGQEELVQNHVAQISQYFLGFKSCYWLSDIASYKKPYQKGWQDFILSYKGPNNIFCFDSSNKIISNEFIDVVNILDFVTKKDFIELVSLLFPEIALNSKFINGVFKLNTKIEVENAVNLINYYLISGKSYKEFLDKWFSKIIVTDYSVFLLAQYFFSQDKENFFDYWMKLKDSFPIEYWISFFAEQLWQAIIFIKMSIALGHSEAKKRAKKLPFSFINKDWRLHKDHLESLIMAHNNLYLIDYKLKNGSKYTLDLWFIKFFVTKH